MKVFISADIEGITTTTVWDDCENDLHIKQMTDEVLACINGAKKAGAKEIVVIDAHDSGINIDPTAMPSGVTLYRNWSGHPYSMVAGIDKTFNAAMFIGYHSPASRAGNPLSHTMTLDSMYIKLNGVLASEFMLCSYACVLEEVPSVFLSGDKTLCEESKMLHPKLITCPVKDGVGRMTINYSPKETLQRIEELSEKALRQDLSNALPSLADNFKLEICFKEHSKAEDVSWYPGMKKLNDTTVSFESNNYFEILRAVKWVL